MTTIKNLNQWDIQPFAQAMFISDASGIWNIISREDAIASQLSEGSRAIWQYEQERALLTAGGPYYLKPEARERVEKLLALGKKTDFGKALAKSPVWHSAALRSYIHDNSRPPRVI